MLASYQYPLLNLFWTMFMIFAFIIWIWLLIYVFMDIFRSHDLGGFAKAMWIIFIIILPILGILVYLIARGQGMTQRSVKEAQQEQQAFDQYVKQTAAGADPADQIAKLADLKDKGTISQAEFDAQKAKLLG
jgi:hypothetical protein